MSEKYKMDDGIIVDTANAQQFWDEDTFWDGRNHISRATGDQFTHQTLYRSRKGRYYIVHTSQWQGSHPRAEWLNNEQAAAWLLANNHEIPGDLQKVARDISE